MPQVERVRPAGGWARGLCNATDVSGITSVQVCRQKHRRSKGEHASAVEGDAGQREGVTVMGKRGLHPNEGDLGDRDLCRELLDEVKDLYKVIQERMLPMEPPLSDYVMEALEAVQAAYFCALVQR
jgi:hypothetical protein